MKTLIKTVLLVLLTTMSISNVFAWDVFKVKKELIKNSTKAFGMETYYNEIIHLEDVVNTYKYRNKKSLSDILKRDIIELVNGEIFYPEEIEFGLVKGKSPGTINRTFGGTIEKSPHEI